MPLLVLAAIAFVSSALLGATVGSSFGPFLQPPQYQPSSAVCLDENVARNGIGAPSGISPRLTKIRRPEKTDFITGQGWDFPSCANVGSCSDHPDESEYVLVATKVKIDPVIFPSGGRVVSASDRQMLRYRLDGQASNDPTVQAQIKGRLFRTFCGDWCCGSPGSGCTLLGPDAPGPLPFRGTFHCDFLFYLEDTDSLGNPQIDANGNLLQPNTVDVNLPKNGSLFSIYFRKDAPIPEKVKCSNTSSDTGVNSQFFNERGLAVLAQDGQSGFPWPPDSGKEWLYRQDRVVKNKDVNPQVVPFPDPATGSNVVRDPLQGVSGEFEVFKNLVYPSSDEILYLVNRGELKRAMDKLLTPTPTQPPPPEPTMAYQQVYEVIHFKEFHLLNVVQPKDVRSLQLGTFFPPQAADWIKKWIDESKPAIYLYPPEETILSIKLNPAGYLTFSDPLYDKVEGWKKILAHPDGYLTYKGKRYLHLYYEAKLPAFSVEPTGFVVKGKNLVSFFQQVLPQLGLAGREIDEFIDYWMGRLSQDQPYYFVHFLSKEQIEYLEPLEISQKPDTEIRLRAYFRPLDGLISVKPQELSKPPKREGFVLVEWGGILDN